MAGVVATNYSEALFALALEENKLDVFCKDLKAIVDVLNESDELKNIMKHPKVGKNDKTDILSKWPVFSFFDFFRSLQSLSPPKLSYNLFLLLPYFSLKTLHFCHTPLPGLHRYPGIFDTPPPALMTAFVSHKS